MLGWLVSGTPRWRCHRCPVSQAGRVPGQVKSGVKRKFLASTASRTPNRSFHSQMLNKCMRETQLGITGSTFFVLDALKLKVLWKYVGILAHVCCLKLPNTFGWYSVWGMYAKSCCVNSLSFSVNSKSSTARQLRVEVVILRPVWE